MIATEIQTMILVDRGYKETMEQPRAQVKGVAGQLYFPLAEAFDLRTGVDGAFRLKPTKKHSMKAVFILVETEMVCPSSSDISVKFSRA